MSFNAPHLLATGLMLLVAFLVGATLGLVLRRLFDLLTRRTPQVVAEGQAVIAPAAAQTVAVSHETAEPAVAEVPEPLDPVVAIDRHVKAPMRPVFSIPELPPLVPAAAVARPSLAPARRAGETASGRLLWSPYQPVDPPARPARVHAQGASATIIPFPIAPNEPPAALVEELEQLMSTPVPVPVSAAEPDGQLEPAAVPVEPAEEPAAVAQQPEPEPAPVVPPVKLTGIPLGLEAQMASALGAELHVPEPPPAAEPSPVADPEPVREPVLALEPELAPAETVAADAPVEAPQQLVEEIEVPEIVPEAEPVAPVAEDADETLVESTISVDEAIADLDPVLELDERIEPEIVEPLPSQEGEAEAEPLPVPEPVVDPQDAPLPEPTDWTDTDPEADEAAAMRAIEGNWSPRRQSAAAAKPLDPPEGVAAAKPEPSAVEALAASAAAVASARRTARAVVEDVSPHSARPASLPGPRDGKPDDLTQIIGILPVVEAALNRLGVYHYDQIAGWGADTVNWVETYLGLEGRIGREHWRLQAHELAEAKPPRPSTGAQDLAKAGE